MDDSRERLMAELHEARATVRTTDKLLKWGGVTFAAAAIAWAAHMTMSDTAANASLAATQVTIGALKESIDKLSREHADTNGKQDVRISDLERALAQMVGQQTSEQLTRLLSAVSQQGERLARIEAQLETIKK